jgi:hypothetical protein
MRYLPGIARSLSCESLFRSADGDDVELPKLCGEKALAWPSTAFVPALVEPRGFTRPVHERTGIWVWPAGTGLTNYALMEKEAEAK